MTQGSEEPAEPTSEGHNGEGVIEICHASENEYTDDDIKRSIAEKSSTTTTVGKSSWQLCKTCAEQARVESFLERSGTKDDEESTVTANGGGRRRLTGRADLERFSGKLPEKLSSCQPSLHHELAGEGLKAGHTHRAEEQTLEEDS